MLESLFFKAEGPILKPVEDPAAWTAGLDPALGRCLPVMVEDEPAEGAATEDASVEGEAAEG